MKNISLLIRIKSLFHHPWIIAAHCSHAWSPSAQRQGTKRRKNMRHNPLHFKLIISFKQLALSKRLWDWRRWPYDLYSGVNYFLYALSYIKVTRKSRTHLLLHRRIYNSCHTFLFGGEETTARSSAATIHRTSILDFYEGTSQILGWVLLFWWEWFIVYWHNLLLMRVDVSTVTIKLNSFVINRTPISSRQAHLFFQCYGSVIFKDR